MSQNKNIGIVIPNLKVGGNKRSAGNISKILSDTYNVYLILFDDKEINNEYAGEVINLNSPPKKNNFSRLIHFFTRMFKMKGVIKKYKLDLIYLFLPPFQSINYIHNKNIKKVISCRDFSSLEKNINLFKRQLDSSNLMICNSNALKDYYLKFYPEDKDKVKTIHNTIDIPYIWKESQQLVEYEFEEFIKGYQTIISVGRLVKVKGFDDLIKSFIELKKKRENIRLILVGDGKLNKELKEMAIKSGYTKDILFLGYQKNPYKYISRCDVFALSSINEGFPNTLIEAMACGLPVVSTNCMTGPNEILNKKYIKNLIVEEIYLADFGILTSTFNEKDDYNVNRIKPEHKNFAKALSKVIYDEKLRTKYKENSVKRSNQFKASNLSGEYKRVISSVISNNNE